MYTYACIKKCHRALRIILDMPHILLSFLFMTYSLFETVLFKFIFSCSLRSYIFHSFYVHMSKQVVLIIIPYPLHVPVTYWTHGLTVLFAM